MSVVYLASTSRLHTSIARAGKELLPCIFKSKLACMLLRHDDFSFSDRIIDILLKKDRLATSWPDRQLYSYQEFRREIRPVIDTSQVLLVVFNRHAFLIHWLRYGGFKTPTLTYSDLGVMEIGVQHDHGICQDIYSILALNFG